MKHQKYKIKGNDKYSRENLEISTTEDNEIISDGFYMVATSFLTGVIILLVSGIIFLNYAV